MSNFQIILMIISYNALFFFLGKMHERWEWSKLIRKGILPKPPGK